MVMFSETQPSSQLEALLLQTAAGDREAFASLYHRTSPSVYGLALTYVHSGPDAEDVTQDTFVKVWDNAPAYRPLGKPLAWILTIAKNLARMCLRSREKSTQLPPEDWASLAMDVPAVTPEDRQVLKAALSTLSQQEQQILLLHAVSGLKHREIAALLELPLPTVLSKYHRGLKKLKIKLEGDAVYE